MNYSEQYFRIAQISRMLLPFDYIYSNEKLLFTLLCFVIAIVGYYFASKSVFRFSCQKIEKRLGVTGIIILTFAFALRLYEIGKEPINYLEWWVLQEGNIFPHFWQTFLSRSGVAIGHQPLFNIIIRLISSISENILFLRAVFCFFSIVYIYFAYRVLSLFFKRKVAYWGILFLAINASAVSTAQQFQIYSLYLALALWQIDSFCRFILFRQKKYHLHFIISSVFIMYVHYFIVVVFFWQFVFLLLLEVKKDTQYQRFLRFIKSGSYILICSLPVIPYILTTFQRGKFIFNAHARLMYQFYTEGTMYPLSLVAGHLGVLSLGELFAAVIFVSFMFLVWRSGKKHTNLFFFSFLAVQIIAFIVMQSFMAYNFNRVYPNFRHYMLLTFCFSFGISIIANSRYKYFILLIFLMNFSIPVIDKSFEQYPDFRKTAQTLKPLIHQGDLITFPNNLWREPFFKQLHNVPGIYLYNKVGLRPLEPSHPEKVWYYYFDLKPRLKLDLFNRIWVIRGKVFYFGQEAYSQRIDNVTLQLLRKSFTLKKSTNIGSTRIELYLRNEKEREH